MTNNYNSKITGERLAKLRKEKGLTQENLAKKFHIDSSLIGHYERGRKIPLDMLYQIAKYFGTSADYLLGLTDIPYTVDDYIAKQKKAGKQPVDNQYSADERKIIDMYRQLSEKDKGKIEGRLEEMLDDEQAATKGA